MRKFGSHSWCQGDVEPGLQHGFEDRCNGSTGRPGNERLRIGRLDAFDLRRDAHVFRIKTLTFDDLYTGILRQFEHFIETTLGVLTGGIGARHESNFGPAGGPKIAHQRFNERVRVCAR